MKTRKRSVAVGNARQIRIRLPRRRLVQLRTEALRDYLTDIYFGRVSAVDALDKFTGRKYPEPRPSLLKMIVDLSDRVITVEEALDILPGVLG